MARYLRAVQKKIVIVAVTVMPPAPDELSKGPLSETPKLILPGRCLAILLAASTASLIGSTYCLNCCTVFEGFLRSTLSAFMITPRIALSPLVKILARSDRLGTSSPIWNVISQFLSTGLILAENSMSETVVFNSSVRSHPAVASTGPKVAVTPETEIPALASFPVHLISVGTDFRVFSSDLSLSIISGSPARTGVDAELPGVVGTSTGK